MIQKLYNSIEYVFSYIFTLLKKKIINVGKQSIIYYKCSIYNKGVINIGNNCLIGRSKKNYHAGMPFYTTLLVDIPEASIIIGNDTRINGAYIHAQNEICIGEKCVIASGVNIIDSNGHMLNSFDRTVGRDKPERIIIGNNVWIGLNVVILKGTVIGDNSVISAGSVVKGVYPNNSLIQGNPAKCTKILDIKNNITIHNSTY